MEDRYISVKVLLPRFGKEQEATIISRKRTHDGKALVGLPNSNPLLDSRINTVEFPDGGTGEYATNMIAESIYSNVDDEGFDESVMAEGEVVVMRDDEGDEVHGVVVHVGEEEVEVDFNHPLAGIDLHFTVQLMAREEG